ncbi:UPF0158 family protein [Georgenia sp. AZ-5]|uniref:UPF0158 family protein n=1 Tax=Georgenia sp. AZ-5 TaxID=3367526 RepID=UPI0037551097
MLELEDVDLDALAEALADTAWDSIWWFDPSTGGLELRLSEEERGELQERGWIEVHSIGSSQAYRDIEDFVGGVEDESARAPLADAIRGAGAAGRFMDALREAPELSELWRRFYADRMRRRALEWLVEEGVVDEGAAAAAIATPAPASAGVTGTGAGTGPAGAADATSTAGAAAPTGTATADLPVTSGTSAATPAARPAEPAPGAGARPVNLLAGPPPVLLPEDHPDVAARAALGAGEGARAVAARLPASSLAWATLARAALDLGDAVTAYAFARTGYHRGLDALRRAGWRGQGPVPAGHPPNQGFLLAVLALADAAAAIGETDEAERCQALLRDCDPGALSVLAPGR